jgi:hypothetical protein
MMVKGLAVMLSVLCFASLVQAATFDLATLLGNSGFEDGGSHAQWTATSPNSNFTVDSPEVNPVIYPNSPLEPPPAGELKFVGIVNPGHEDVAGRLVQTVAGTFPNGSSFVVTVCGTRGHLRNAPPNPGQDVFSPNVGKPSPQLRVQFFGWKEGSTPVVDATTDNWNRTPTFKSAAVSFTAWTHSGMWACQSFSFGPTTKPLVYVALGISGINHRAGTYVAFDVVPTP